MQENIILDSFDWKHLSALQKDASQTNSALGDKVGLSPSQVSRRRQRLEQAQVLIGYRAVIAPAAVGLGIVVFVHVSLSAHSKENARRFRHLVQITPAILEAHALTGKADYLVKVAVSGLNDLAYLINEILLPHGSVAKVRSEIVLETLKESGPLPLSGE